MNFRSNRHRTALLCYLFVLLALLAGCQPSVEERLSRAETYRADGEFRAADIELRNLLSQQPDNAEAHALEASVSYMLGDLSAAQMGYQRALELGMDQPDVWIGLGRALTDAGQAQEAFARVVPNLPEEDASEAQSVLVGDILMKLGNVDDAAQQFAAATNSNPDSVGGLLGAAAIALARKQPEIAAELVDKAVSRNPGSMRAWLARGKLSVRQQDLHAAADAFRQAAAAVNDREDPVQIQYEAGSQLVSVLLDSQQFDAAVAELEQLQNAFSGYPYNAFLEGRIAFSQQEYEHAFTALQRYMSLAPDDLRGTLMLGAVTLAQGKLEQAEMYLSQAVRANVGGERARRMLAEAQMLLNQPDQALLGLRRSEAAGQDDPMLFSMLGRAEIGAGNIDAAIRYFERSAAAGSTTPAVALSTAAGFLAAGEYGRGVKMLESMPAMDDDRYRRETLLIAAYMQHGERDKAISTANALLRDNPDDAAVYTLVGALHQTLGDSKSAAEKFGQALGIDPNNTVALYALARLARASGDFQVARTNLDRLLSTRPSFLPALNDMVVVLRLQDDDDALEPYLDAAIKAAPDQVMPRVLQIQDSLRHHELDLAQHLAREAENRFPDDAAIMHISGLVQLQRGQTEAALAYLTRAANAVRDNAEFQFDLAAARYQSHDAIGTISALRHFRELKPDDIRGLALQVRAELARGSTDRARTALAGYRERHDGPAYQLNVLAGEIALSAGDGDGAVRHYANAADDDWNRAIALRLAAAYQAAGSADVAKPLERWLQDHPDDSEVRLDYAQALQAQGRAQQASREYERLVRSGGGGAIALNNLAWEYALAGKDGAADLARRALEMDPENGSVMDTLGWILYREGKMQEALKFLRQAATQQPSNPEIQFHLATVLTKTGDADKARAILENLAGSDVPFPSRREAEELARSL